MNGPIPNSANLTAIVDLCPWIRGGGAKGEGAIGAVAQGRANPSAVTDVDHAGLVSAKADGNE